MLVFRLDVASKNVLSASNLASITAHILSALVAVYLHSRPSASHPLSLSRQQPKFLLSAISAPPLD